MDKKFIAQEKRYRRKITEITAQIYASFAIALHREYGFGYDRILRAFRASQDVWQKAIDEGISVYQQCEDETGIDIMSTVTAKENGVDSKDADEV